MLDIPSHHILFLVTIGVGYLTQELLFEFAFTIGNLRQSTYPNLVNPWLLLTSFKPWISSKSSPTLNTGSRLWPFNFKYMVRLTKCTKRLNRYTYNLTHLKTIFSTAEAVLKFPRPVDSHSR